uniref:Uncharacterized protein n=1 Tax=Aegilops tauschii subsp. strangulata TaxID=200361 RepID=A0A453NJ88_AEGTS
HPRRGGDYQFPPESLTYRLNSDICIVDEIRVRPYQAFFQDGDPIYSSKMVRFRMGHYKLPRGSETFVMDDYENKMVNADEKYTWTYTSPAFPMLQVSWCILLLLIYIYRLMGKFYDETPHSYFFQSKNSYIPLSQNFSCL